jgi:hypothetical protein
MADEKPIDAHRIGGWGGIGATALLAASIFVVKAPPGMRADADEIKAFLLDNRSGGNLSVLTAALALPLLVLFLAGLRERLTSPEGDGWLPGVATQAGTLFGLGLVVGNACFYSATWTKETSAAPAETFRATWDLGYLVYLGLFPLGALLLAGVGAAALRSRRMPAWWGWLGIVVGAAILVGSVAIVSYTAASVSFPTYLGFMVWLLTGGIVLLRADGSTREQET